MQVAAPFLGWITLDPKSVDLPWKRGPLPGRPVSHPPSQRSQPEVGVQCSHMAGSCCPCISSHPTPRMLRSLGAQRDDSRDTAGSLSLCRSPRTEAARRPVQATREHSCRGGCGLPGTRTPQCVLHRPSTRRKVMKHRKFHPFNSFSS